MKLKVRLAVYLGLKNEPYTFLAHFGDGCRTLPIGAREQIEIWGRGHCGLHSRPLKEKCKCAHGHPHILTAANEKSRGPATRTLGIRESKTKKIT